MNKNRSLIDLTENKKEKRWKKEEKKSESFDTNPISARYIGASISVGLMIDRLSSWRSVRLIKLGGGGDMI